MAEIAARITYKTALRAVDMLTDIGANQVATDTLRDFIHQVALDSSAMQGKLDAIVRVLSQDRDSAREIYDKARAEVPAGANTSNDVIAARSAWLEAKAAAATARRIADRNA